jgi:predicted O-methyltransferase YrrM
MGVHAVPVHFYHPVPDTRQLPEETWSKRYDLTGVDLREETQLALLATFARYKPEYDELPFDRVACGYYVNNGRFEHVDGEVLYSMIREFKPRRIFEIGPGYSTQLATLAASVNEAEGAPATRIVAIEPFPTHDVLQLKNIEIWEMPVEKIPLGKFDELQANDILFIDSSHVVRIGGDVVREYLELLPRLKPGVLVHCHDIHLPADYSREIVLGERTFWDEQYLLHAFLLFNSQYEILWASHYMHLRHPDELARAFASYPRCSTPPTSFWMRRRTE